MDIRNGQPDCDDRKNFVAMTSTNLKIKVRSRLWVSVSSIFNLILIA